MRLKHLLGPLPNVSAAALITAIFCLFFIVLCWYVFRRDRRSIYEHLEKLPFSEDGNE
ncbi:MAG: CcoQ/FixQ family Cbb3-type cytochrome c oxidase assembly chaperone [Deltaproteobacteria bacterium]|nr:CcoQ/FixQ family Cbb3-type cytochrome c oxidase assembly chaperone [Deltaproteobacteria bacterium]